MNSERGASVNAGNSEGVIPLHEAVDRGDRGIIVELLRGNADVRMKSTRGYI